MGDRALGNSAYHFIMIIEVFQIPISLFFGRLELLNRSISVAQVYSKTLLRGLLVLPLAKLGLRTVQHILALSHSSLHVQQAVDLVSSIIEVINLVGLIAGRQHASTDFIIARHLWDYSSVRIYHHKLMFGKSLDLGSGPVPVVFRLQSGHEFTPFFVRQETKIRIFVFHLILHGFGQTVICFNADLIFGKIAILDFTIDLVIRVTLLLRGGKVLIYIMHLTDTLPIMEYVNPKGFHNFIVNVLHLISERAFVANIGPPSKIRRSLHKR